MGFLQKNIRKNRLKVNLYPILSITYIVFKQRLFKHDHRNEDGTPDSISYYGGLANSAKSTPYSQSFPADAFTAKLIPAVATNEWSIILDLTTNMFDYMLTRDNIYVFMLALI